MCTYNRILTNTRASMHTSSSRSNRGFIELIVVVIVALVILQLLDIDIRTLLAQEWVRNFAIYVRDMIKLVWADLKEIFAFIKSIAN